MKTVICHSCGASVDENVKKCPYCDTIVNENGIDIDEVRRKEIELREKCIQLLKEGKIIRARFQVAEALNNKYPIINHSHGKATYTYISDDVTAYLSKIKGEEGIPDVMSVSTWLCLIITSISLTWCCYEIIYCIYLGILGKCMHSLWNPYVFICSMFIGFFILKLFAKSVKIK